MNRIPELRKERGISMKQAAEQLGMPYTTYVNYEKGVRQANSETLIDLANFYNTSIDYMLGKSSDRLQINGAATPIPPGQESKKTPGAKSGEISDEEIKFALFGGGPVTDAQYEEVKQFVRFIKERDANAGKG